MPLNWLNWLATFSLLILVSCASPEPKEIQPHYSNATEQTFDEIEKTRVLDYYRQLRARGNPDLPSTRPTVIRPKPYQERTTRRPRPTATPKPVPTLSIEQREAIEREVSQNLSYFCMLNRKDSRFSDEADCTAYTQDVLYDCRKKVVDDNLRNLVRCVKNELNL